MSDSIHLRRLCLGWVRLLSHHGLLWPLVERSQQEFRETGRQVLSEGRPTIALETYVRLMVLKARRELSPSPPTEQPPTYRQK